MTRFALASTMIVASIIARPGSPEARWPQAMLASERSARALKSAALVGKVHAGVAKPPAAPPHKGIVSGGSASERLRNSGAVFDTPITVMRPQTPEERQAYSSYLAELKRIDVLELGRAWKGFKTAVEADLRSPASGIVMNETYAQRLANADFHLGRPEDAYRVLVPFVARTDDRKTLAQASLAAALLGESYTGQAEFCTREIMLCSTESSLWTPYVPSGRTSSELAFLSYLALGSSYNGGQEGSTYYYEQSLRLRPGNPVATLLLLISYSAEPDQRTQEGSLRRNEGILSAAISNTQAGRLKVELDNWRHAVREGITQRVWLHPARLPLERDKPAP